MAGGWYLGWAGGWGRFMLDSHRTLATAAARKLRFETASAREDGTAAVWAGPVNARDSWPATARARRCVVMLLNAKCNASKWFRVQAL